MVEGLTGLWVFGTRSCICFDVLYLRVALSTGQYILWGFGLVQ